MIDPKDVKELYQVIFDMVKEKEYEDALPLIRSLLDSNPNDSAALNFLGVMHLEMQNYYLAYQFLRRALQEAPEKAALWTNFGLAASELGRDKEAMNSYLKSAELDNNYFKAYDNASALLVNQAKWDEAEKLCRLSLELSPEGKMSNQNLAHIYLAKHDWVKGWKQWELSLGGKYRKEWVYGDESRWDGSPGKAVVIYGEQGLGDEINYSSCIPDAIADCKKVIIDCDPRLEKLFKRSFPKADVHGTRLDDSPKWLDGARIDARCSVSSLPGFYRPTDEAFPGKPYLKADPELVSMFKAMWGAKPAYGLCLHGGSKLTNEKGRKIEPEDFSPLLGLDATFVSLDYKGSLNNPRIKEYKWATQAKDYDLTAALIASLDAVIGVNTTAMHCANGLGIPTHIILPEYYQWRYEGKYLWSKTCTLYHKQPGDTWRDQIKRVVL